METLLPITTSGLHRSGDVFVGRQSQADFRAYLKLTADLMKQDVSTAGCSCNPQDGALANSLDSLHSLLDFGSDPGFAFSGKARFGTIGCINPVPRKEHHVP